MEEIFDPYTWTKQNKTIIHSRHQIKGLGNFTHCNTQESTPPSPLHYHTNILEIHCMTKGQRTSLVENKGSFNSYTFTGNTAFITFPFEIHGNGDAPQPPSEFYAFQIDLSDSGELLGLDQEYSHALTRLLANQTHRHLRLNSSHLNYLRTAFNFISSLEPETIRVGVQFLTCFLYSLQYLTPISHEEKTSIDEHIHRSILYLNDHILQSLQLQDMADVAGYSLSHYKQKFKKEVGITPSEYVNLQKLEYAKNALANSDINITELAYTLGFSSSNYFCSVFRKFMDCTPRDYRRKLQMRKFENTRNLT